MKTIVTDAIILKRIDYGEADRILTVLTRDRGKLSLLAKGVRRSKSKLAGGLELFSVTTISYIDGKSDLKTVVGTQLQRFYDGIVGDIARVTLAYDFLKLTDTLTEEHTETAYFQLLDTALASLHDPEVDAVLTEAWLRMQLSMAAGEGLMLDHTTDGQPFSDDTMYQFDDESMGFVAHARGNISPRHIKLLRLISKASIPVTLLKVQGGDELLPQLADLLRRVNHRH